ncbi:MAG: RusA family crossover junction endodeoxyribonuclease [Desulfobacterales bacterium]|nr:RusA family crossover junction endodeoxyribonuclease [Desulfobacterales bacterium]
MIDIITLRVPGEPQGKLRPKWSPVGTYTPKKTINYETYIKQLFATKYPSFQPLEGELTLELGIYQTIPKSFSKKKKDLMERRIVRPTKRPDIDNVIKSVFDALEGLAYKNDSQFIEVAASKFFDLEPRLNIRITKG